MKAKIKMGFLVFVMVIGILLSVMTVSAYQGEAVQEAWGTPAIEETMLSESTWEAAETAAEESHLESAADISGVSTVEEKATDGETSSIREMEADEGISADGEDPSTEAPQAVGTIQGDGTGETPFSIPGNGLLLDDKSEDGTKQFLTIRTRNGNTFFMVLDRSNNTENVYMLSMIDENDLAEFIEETKDKSKTETPSLIIPQKETMPAATELEAEPEKDKAKLKNAGGMNTGMVFVLLVFLIGCIGGFYYFKVVKPKREEEDAEVEDLEFYDGGAYINEDQEDLEEVDE